MTRTNAAIASAAESMGIWSLASNRYRAAARSAERDGADNTARYYHTVANTYARYASERERGAMMDYGTQLLGAAVYAMIAAAIIEWIGLPSAATIAMLALSAYVTGCVIVHTMAPTEKGDQ